MDEEQARAYEDAGTAAQEGAQEIARAADAGNESADAAGTGRAADGSGTGTDESAALGGSGAGVDESATEDGGASANTQHAADEGKDATEEKAAAAALGEQLRQVTDRLRTAMSEAAAVQLGVPPTRARYAARLAETEGIDINVPDASERLTAAIGKVLEEVPELRGATGGTGSPGAFARRAEAAEDAARDIFARALRRG